MIGIAENNLRFHLAQLAWRHRLDCSLGADRHEGRCLDHPVPGDEPAAAGFARFILAEQGKHRTKVSERAGARKFRPDFCYKERVAKCVFKLTQI